MKYSKEKEREYYNQKLIKDSIKSDISNTAKSIGNGTYKFPWKDFLISATGTILGFIVCDMIKTDTLIPNKGLKFCADVVILVVMITLVNLAFMGFSKLFKPKSN